MKRSKLYLCLGIISIGMVIFYVYPFVNGLLQSFMISKANGNAIGVENYINLFKNESFRLALTNTVVFTIVSVVLLNIVSFVFAMLLSGFKRKNIYMYLIIIPYVVPVIGTVSVWKYIATAISNEFIYGDLSILLIIAIFIWKYVGFHTIIYLSGILSIPKPILEAARVDGSEKWNYVCKIILPQIIGFVAFNLVFSVIHSFKIFRDIFLLFGYYPTNKAYLIQHFIQNNFTNLNYNLVLCAGYVFSFLTLIVLIPLLNKIRLEGKYNGN